jgi:hypothetical protein
VGQPERGRQAKTWAWWRVLSRLVVVTAMAACASALAPAVGWAGPATHFVVSAPASATAGTAFSFTVTAADQFGNTDTSYSGTVHFTTTDTGAGASLPADSHLTNGTGSFSATLVTAGSQTITATDTVNPITGTSNPIAVSAAGATHFAVSAPSSATSGTAFNFTVTAQDQFNNTATGYTGTVIFTSTDGQATLPTNSNLSNGTGTFSATLKTAGTQTITATDQSFSSITGTSNAIAVSAAAATHFTVSAPSSATSGAAFSFTVTAQDQFNNTATGYTGTVQFTSTDGQASLPANSTLTNGTGTFSATLKTAGSQTITATDKNNSSITGTSNAIAVSAAAAAHFAVSAPSSATSGTAFSFTVTAQDAFNNTATGYAGTVQFTSSDGQAVLPANSTLTNGTGTFSATLKTAGTQTITATDKNNSSITGTSNQIAVSSAGATHFAVSAPAAATAGAPFNFTVTAQDQFNNTATGYTGTVHFTSTDGQGVLPGDSPLTNGTGTFSATLKTTGAQTITATDKNNSSITGTSNTITVGLKASSNTTLASSQNPSSFGQSVTFTTTVAGGITPTGTVTFKDGATVLGTSTLNASAQASFTTASLSIGTHAITATYSGDPNNFSSTSAVLNQAVNVPADSLKLRALQIEVTKIEAQGSGQAVSGAIDSAIADAFSGGAPVSASDNGVHFSFASDAPPQETQKTFEERFGQAFSALGYAGDPVVKAPPRAIPKEWFPWADVRGINWNTGLQTGDIRGGQTNGTFGLTRKLSPDVLVGVFGGGEIFDYTSQLLNGRLKGTGWTAGGYFSWRMLPGLRFDLGGGHSELSYDGVAGTAAGSFPGHRWIATAALVGSLKTASGFEVEPSARVYGLWEHEDAYTDSLGVTQADRDFSTGRASAGARVGHAWIWSPTTLIFPYVGGYADYYFNSDNALLPAGAPFLLPTQFVQGWSARVTSGVGVRFSSGPQFSIGGEVGGLGSNQFTTWTVRGRAAVPF